MSPSFGSSKEAMISAALKVYWEEFNKTSCASCKEEPKCGGYAQQAEKFWNELNASACPPQCPPPQGNAFCPPQCPPPQGNASCPPQCPPPKGNSCSYGGGGGGAAPPMQGCLSKCPAPIPSTHTSVKNVDMGGGQGGPSLVLVCEGNLQSGLCAYKTVQSLSKCAAAPPCSGGRVEPPVEEVWSQQQKGTSCSGMRPSCRQVGEAASTAHPSVANASCSGMGVKGGVSCGVGGAANQGSAVACGSERPSCVGIGRSQAGSELFPEECPSGAVGGVAKEGGKTAGGKYADFGSWLGSPCDRDRQCGPPCGKQ